MGLSARMRWYIPARDSNPWFHGFESLTNAQDATASSLIEAKNIILTCSGVVTFDASTGTLSWSSPIDIVSLEVGFLHQIAAGSTTLQDGQCLFVSLSPFPSGNITTEPLTGFTRPGEVSMESFFVLCIRRGNRCYFRNGLVVASSPARFGASPLPPQITDVSSSEERAQAITGLSFWPFSRGGGDCELILQALLERGTYALVVRYHMATANAGNIVLRVDRSLISPAGDPSTGLTMGASFSVTPGSNTMLQEVTPSLSAAMLVDVNASGTVGLFRFVREDSGGHPGVMRVISLSLVPYVP